MVLFDSIAGIIARPQAAHDEVPGHMIADRAGSSRKARVGQAGLALAPDPFGLRHFIRGPQTDCEINGADRKRIAVIQYDVLLNSTAPNQRPIGATQIVERNPPIRTVNSNSRVAA